MLGKLVIQYTGMGTYCVTAWKKQGKRAQQVVLAHAENLDSLKQRWETTHETMIKAIEQEKKKKR